MTLRKEKHFSSVLFEDSIRRVFIQFLCMQSDITERGDWRGVSRSRLVTPDCQHILTASPPLQVCGPREM